MTKEYMSRNEALEFFDGTIINFSHYHKHIFIYTGEKDGKRLKVIYEMSDVYRADFCAQERFHEDLEDVYHFNSETHNGEEEYIFGISG